MFDSLPAGTYAIAESQPEVLSDGPDASSAAGATVDNDKITAIDLGAGESIGGNNFGENAIRPDYITIHMFLASTPPMDEYLCTLVAYGEAVAGNTDMADAIRNGQTDYDEVDTNVAPVAHGDGYAVEREHDAVGQRDVRRAGQRYRRRRRRR